MKKLDGFRGIVELWEGIEKEAGDLISLAKLSESDKKIEKEIEKSFKDLKKKFSKNEFQALFSGKYDSRSAILAIHSGSGGTEAQDWAEMLLRMYLRWAETKGYSAKILDQSFGQEA